MENIHEMYKEIREPAETVADVLMTDRQIMESGSLQTWQSEMLLSNVPFKLAATSRQVQRVGKTLSLKAIIVKEGLERHNLEILILATTLKQSKAIHWRPLFTSNTPIFEPHLIKSINKTDLVCELHNGTRIACASSEAIDALRGRTADIVNILKGVYCHSLF